MSGSAKPKPGAASDSTCSANKLFVYGTLLSGYKPQGPADLVPPNTLQKARLLGGATVRGFEMRDIGQYPCIVTGAKESAVVGEVFELSDPGQWKVLDEYEGISDEIEQPHDYRREEATVKMTTTGSSMHVQIYVFNLPVDHLPRIPSGDFLLHFQQKRNAK